LYFGQDIREKTKIHFCHTDEMYGRKSAPKRRISDWQKYQDGVEENSSTAYRKSYMRNRLVPKWMTLTIV